MNTECLHLLIVEDEAAHVEAIRRAFKDEGVNVEISAVGTLREYRERIATQTPDLALIDLNLPDGQAVEVLTYPPDNAPFPVLVMTAFGNQKISVEAMKAGALDYVVKSPEVFANMPQAVERVCRRWELLQLNKQAEVKSRLQTSALSAAANAIVITDQTGNVVWANPAFTKLTGYESSEMLGKNPRILKSGQHDDAFYHQMWETITAGNVWSGELVNKRKDGSLYTEEMTITPVRTERGVIAHFIAVKQDITERKQGVEALRQTNEQLEQALSNLKRAQSKMLEQERLRIVGQMASGIAHDFNNSLSPILGFCELLLENADMRQDDKKLREFLELMLSAAKDAASVVRQLRELYREHTDDDELVAIKLHKVAQQAVMLTEPRWRDEANAAGATIHVELDLPSVPDILGSESSLREVIMNLILNAVDALPEGGTITVRTRHVLVAAVPDSPGLAEAARTAATTPADGNYVVLEISDSGMGMTEEVRQRCFEPFYTTKGARGTGLGLAMVRGIVHNHGGHTSVASVLGKGTTFTLRFPIQAATEKAGPATKPEGPLRQLRILLMDDEMVVRRVCTEYLRVDGHQVEAVESGPAGLVAFARQPFDLVVTDMAMEGMSGEQLAARIHEMSPGTPIILLTGFGDLMKARGKKPLDVAVVLSKPATLGGLRAAIRDAMQDKPKGTA